MTTDIHASAQSFMQPDPVSVPITVRLMRTVAWATSRFAPNLAVALLQRMFETPQKQPVRSREKLWMEGARVERLPIDRGRSVPVYSWGDGPTVLLVHGFSGRASQMAIFAAPLVEAGFRVVAFDAPAHGDADGRRTVLPDMASAIEAVLEHLGPVRAVIGHSAGAAAMVIALGRGAPVDRTVLIAPPENLEGFLHRIANFAGFPPEISAQVRRRVEMKYDLPFAAARGGSIVPSLKVPALILHDRDDRMVPFEEGERLGSLWPGAGFVETSGLGHNRILRDEAIVEQAVRFILDQSS